ncbi:hypothetical protein [Shewanella xiamenensis]|uniref:hypothetical protein n=1 Tax=Shewanella xiamenensis TaxID=332186 RepID=UPI002949F2C3|nr:hypothetical protein [Shewanella xiamenensis]MDV5245504.1 hypothetical protein [Shewanella xiamenensis]
MKKNILAIVCYSKSIDFHGLSDIIKKQLKPFNFDSIIILNNYSEIIYWIKSGLVVNNVIKVDSNDKYEFSGYLALLEYIEENKIPFDTLFIVNDTLATHAPLRLIERLGIFYYFFQKKSIRLKSICGFIHQPIFINQFDLPLYSYFNSKFFMVGRDSLGLFGDALKFCFTEVDIISGKYVVEWDGDYNGFLKRWLNESTAPCWYESEPLTDSNKDKFLRKSKCILFEHRLSYYLFTEANSTYIKNIMPGGIVAKILLTLRKFWW